MEALPVAAWPQVARCPSRQTGMPLMRTNPLPSAITGDAVMANMINFYKNISIAGAFLLLAIVGPGKISLDRR